MSKFSFSFELEGEEQGSPPQEFPQPASHPEIEPTTPPEISGEQHGIEIQPDSSPTIEPPSKPEKAA